LGHGRVGAAEGGPWPRHKFSPDGPVAWTDGPVPGPGQDRPDGAAKELGIRLAQHMPRREPSVSRHTGRDPTSNVGGSSVGGNEQRYRVMIQQTPSMAAMRRRMDRQRDGDCAPRRPTLQRHRSLPIEQRRRHRRGSPSVVLGWPSGLVQTSILNRRCLPTKGSVAPPRRARNGRRQTKRRRSREGGQ